MDQMGISCGDGAWKLVIGLLIVGSTKEQRSQRLGSVAGFPVSSSFFQRSFSTADFIEVDYNVTYSYPSWQISVEDVSFHIYTYMI
jgi:hypothetical protein